MPPGVGCASAGAGCRTGPPERFGPVRWPLVALALAVNASRRPLPDFNSHSNTNTKVLLSGEH